MTRQRKTPRQRAEEALAVADRKVQRLTKDRDRLESDLRTIRRDLEAETARRDHLANHPDLKQQNTNPNTEETPTT